MSDPRKNFVCSKCGCVLNDTQRPWGSESICPVCREKERGLKSKRISAETKAESLKCPDCGGEVTYYHSSISHGDGITRIVCAKKCQGWKVIKEIDRNRLHRERERGSK